MRGARSLKPAVKLAVCLGVSVFLSFNLFGTVSAQEQSNPLDAPKPEEPLFTVKAPPGFGNDDIEQETIVDIIINGRKIASTAAKFDGETIRFNDPEGLAALIPAVKEHKIVADALSKPLAQNRELACSPYDPKPKCGYLQPDIVGVIFNPDKFEAQIFISELYTYNRDSRARYLPPPTKGAGMALGVNARGFYDFDNARTTLNSNIDFITGYDRTHFRADIFANSQGGVNLRGANLNYVGRTLEASAGFLPFRNNSTLARSDRLAGVRIGSTLKTRMDQSSLRAADIPIFVTSSARIETRRDGKLIDVQRVEPGQTTLDTTRFPGGSYDIVLTIIENETTREETRYFSSSSQLPPTGAPQWYIEAGFPTQNSAQGSFLPTLNNELAVNGGYSRRINASLGLEGKISVSESDQYAESSLFFLSQNYSFSTGLIGSVDGDYGGFANLSYHQGNWQVSGNYRDVRAKDAVGIIVNGRYDPFPQSFRQASIRTSYRFEKGSIGVRGFYRQSGVTPDSYFAGPFVEYSIFKTAHSNLALSANYETGNTRSLYFVGLRLSTNLKARKPRQTRSLSAQTNLQTDTAKPSGTKTTREIAEATIRQTQNGYNGNKSEYFAGVRYDQDIIGARAGLNKQTSIGNLGLELRKNYQRQSNLFMDVSTGIALGSGHLALFPRFQDSGMFMDIKGSSDTKFSVLTSGSNRASASNTRTPFVPLQPYKLYDVTIKPMQASDVDYDYHSDRLVLYPGNFPVVQRNANTVTILVGRVLRGGRPLKIATIQNTKQLAVTDENGYFQIDYAGEKSLTLSKNGESLCEVDMSISMSTIKKQPDFADIGDIECK